MKIDEQLNLVELEHLPVKPPRPGTPGEGIYLDLWRDYLAANPRRLDSILRDTMSEPTQRDATVCASFMVFMGCNGGRDLAGNAQRLLSSSRMRSHEAFMAAWANLNERRRGVDHGLRAIEYILAPEHPIRHPSVGGCAVDWQKVPEITMQDIDVIECMVVWWSTADAAEMRSIAEPMIEAATKKHLSEIFRRSEP
ncbi:MAG: hypothetical protein KKD97_15985 [Gammaproteobacteria bacterium]|nr:hypothetical protein [Gammaproteobacteria bacterium]